MTRIWKATGIAFGALMTLITIAAVAAAFASCAGCGPARATTAQIVAPRLASPIARIAASEVMIVVRWSEDGDDYRGSGSGSVVFKTDKLATILTAYHVVHHGEQPKIEVFAGGARFEALVEAIAPESDLALLTVFGNVDREVATIAEKLPERYSRVIEVGFPAGRFAVAEGFLVGAETYRSEDEKDPMNGTVLAMVTDAFFWPGASGGAVANAAGELIGTVDACYAQPAPIDLLPAVNVPQIGLMVPISRIRKFLSMSGVAL